MKEIEEREAVKVELDEEEEMEREERERERVERERERERERKREREEREREMEERKREKEREKEENERLERERKEFEKWQKKWERMQKAREREKRKSEEKREKERKEWEKRRKDLGREKQIVRRELEGDKWEQDFTLKRLRTENNWTHDEDDIETVPPNCDLFYQCKTRSITNFVNLKFTYSFGVGHNGTLRLSGPYARWFVVAGDGEKYMKIRFRTQGLDLEDVLLQSTKDPNKIELFLPCAVHHDVYFPFPVAPEDVKTVLTDDGVLTLCAPFTGPDEMIGWDTVFEADTDETKRLEEEMGEKESEKERREWELEEREKQMEKRERELDRREWEIVQRLEKMHDQHEDFMNTPYFFPAPLSLPPPPSQPCQMFND